MSFGALNIYGFVPPLVVAISLVYAASRHESWTRIGWHAARLTGTILGIMLAAMVVLLVVNSLI